MLRLRKLITCALATSLTLLGSGGFNGRADDGSEQLALEDARKYLLSLINKDRSAEHLPLVELDDVATKAGQLHAEEMVMNGYLSHWGLDGKKPYMRYTDCGGADEDSENAYLIGDTGIKLPLAAEQKFARKDLETIESSFMAEKPPDDGHRKNILEPSHNYVGLALALAKQGDEYAIGCTQEFIDRYGVYDPLPKTVKHGDHISVSGTLNKGVKFDLIELSWEEAPHPMSIAELNKTYAYGSADKDLQSWWAKGVSVDPSATVSETDKGTNFQLDIPLSKPDWKPGMYSVYVWAYPPGTKESVIVSERTILMTK